MTRLLSGRGYDVAAVTQVDELVSALEEPTHLLVLGACWFSMTDDRYTPEQRAEFAVSATAELKASLRSVIHAGTPLLALHTAVLCFDGWSEWSTWLGAEWNWQTSFHPPPSALDVTINMQAAGRLGAVKTVDCFSVVDEEYQGLDVAGHVDVVAASAAGHPLAWVCSESPARVAVDLLGHDQQSLEQPGHQLLLNGLLDWLTAHPDSSKPKD